MANDGSDHSSENDDEDILRAQALAANEDLVLIFARKNGLSFDVALGRLLEKRALSLKSYAVKALNFTDSVVRGGDLKRSILTIEKYSKNAFSFQRKLMKLIGAKNENELNKKILDYQFNNALMLICALGAQFDRLEKRYILNGISIYDAFCRRVDFCNTLMAICSDLYQFGINNNLLHYIHEFSSELVNPKRKLDTIDEKNVTIDDSQCNNNSNKNSNANNDSNETFVFDGKELMYTNENGVKILIQSYSPIWNLYNKNRSQFGAGDKKETWVDLFAKNEIPEFCENGACFKFNFGCDGCPFAEPCKIKTEPHIFTHYCALGGCKNTPIYNCKFLRCFMFLSKCTDDSWLQKTYSLKWDSVYEKNFYKKTPRAYRGNRSDRGSRSGGSKSRYNNNPSGRSGYDNHRYQRNYDDRQYDDYNDQYYDSSNNNYDNRNKRNDRKRGYNANNGNNQGSHGGNR